MSMELDGESRGEGGRPLTLLKAYRIFHNLDTNKICDRAEISRSYLTRVEQGAAPSVDIAARLVRVLRDVDNIRSTHIPATAAKAELLEAARRLVERNKATHSEFADGRISEIHLLYPHRYLADGHPEA